MSVNSNQYIVSFAALLTVILGGLLALAAEGLKPLQKEQIALDTKKQILSAVINTKGEDKKELAKIYKKRIRSIAVDFNGKELDELKDRYGNPLTPEKVNIRKEFKKERKRAVYPVFQYVAENDTSIVEAYILPIYGNGLWDNIWGYVAIEADLKTIKGISFDHKGETPGLGARITTLEIQNRYKGKKIYDANENLVSVNMMKGENNSNLGQHHVDGMSGATITARGVNEMLKSYLTVYQNFFNLIQRNK